MRDSQCQTKKALLKPTKFSTLDECKAHYENGDVLNKFKIMHIGESLVIRNYYNGQFAWLCEYMEMTKEELEELNEQICEES